MYGTLPVYVSCCHCGTRFNEYLQEGDSSKRVCPACHQSISESAYDEQARKLYDLLTHTRRMIETLQGIKEGLTRTNHALGARMVALDDLHELDENPPFVLSSRERTVSELTRAIAEHEAEMARAIDEAKKTESFIANQFGETTEAKPSTENAEKSAKKADETATPESPSSQEDKNKAIENWGVLNISEMIDTAISTDSLMGKKLLELLQDKVSDSGGGSEPIAQEIRQEEQCASDQKR